MSVLDVRHGLPSSRHLAAAPEPGGPGEGPGAGPVGPGAGLLGLDPHGLDDVSLGDHIAALEVLIRRAQAAQARAVRVFEVRDAADAFGAPSAKAWLCANLGSSEREARSLVALGRSTDRLPAIAAAFADGAATATHLRIAAAASRPLSAATVADGDVLLARLARVLDSRSFGTVVDRWVTRVAPAEFERDTEKRFDSRWLSVTETFAGMHSIQGMLDPEAGQMLAGALAALVGANPGDDTRTRQQQNADALADLTRAALGGEASGGVRPEIVVHAGPDTVAAVPGAVPAELAGAGPVPQVTFDRLACDARWRRLLLDAAGVPAELGRATRDVPPGLRKLVALRDGGCRYPGCVRGPSYCDAHHAVFWRDGGTTDSANLVLLCRYHHHLVHERRHHLTLLPDAGVKVVRPSGRVLTSRPRGVPYVRRE